MEKSSHPVSRRLMLTIPKESLALVREVVLESKATIEPVVNIRRGRGKKALREVNRVLINILALDRASMAAEVVLKVLPEHFRNEKVKVYLLGDEFRTLLALIKGKNTQNLPGCKWHSFWCQLTMAELVFGEKFGPME